MYDELTKVDIEKLQAELDHRVRELRPQLIEEVKVARGFGDLSGRKTATRAASGIWSA